MKGPESNLPELWSPATRRMRRVNAGEVVRYARRPGLAALPEGGFAIFCFALLQIFPSIALMWAVWWPYPTTTGGMAFSIVATAVLAAAWATAMWIVLRRQLVATARTLLIPFVRLTVTDRRVMWTLPWKRLPLMQIEDFRVFGGVHSAPDRRGWAAAAILLHPDDPAGDEDGMVRFERLPDAAGFVDAVRALS